MQRLTEILSKSCLEEQDNVVTLSEKIDKANETAGEKTEELVTLENKLNKLTAALEKEREVLESKDIFSSCQGNEKPIETAADGDRRTPTGECQNQREGEHSCCKLQKEFGRIEAGVSTPP